MTIIMFWACKFVLISLPSISKLNSGSSSTLILRIPFKNSLNRGSVAMIYFSFVHVQTHFTFNFAAWITQCQHKFVSSSSIPILRKPNFWFLNHHGTQINFRTLNQNPKKIPYLVQKTKNTPSSIFSLPWTHAKHFEKKKTVPKKMFETYKKFKEKTRKRRRATYLTWASTTWRSSFGHSLSLSLSTLIFFFFALTLISL